MMLTKILGNLIGYLFSASSFFEKRGCELMTLTLLNVLADDFIAHTLALSLN